MKFGVVNISDRAAAGVYEDTPGKEAVAWLREAVAEAWGLVYAVVPDDEEKIAATLIDMADVQGCCLVLTTGGTGPAPRDVTPEATMKVCDRLLPGFGESMRAESRKIVPTAILSRQVAGTRGRCLIVNLPGKPTAIRECLEVIAGALPYAIQLVSGEHVTYQAGRTPAFRPKP
ncbi:MAG TPA: molybdopterin adenylyltransferase [Kiritimatiellia bacterium]|nr:molybdopterin adenylyltransferase [Kiritimatiellia bacterium]HMP33597.1 molybdopterin adenylyltransferase [Kiritimatiellia bacterium]